MKSSKKILSRRKFLGLVGFFGLGSAGYVRFFEPQWLDIGRHEISLSKNGSRAALKILQLSDFHASPVVSLGFIAESIRLGLSLKPDLICLTGDFITRKFDELESYAKVLAPLAKAAPTVACLGNHDGGLWAGRRRGYEDTQFVRHVLSDSGVELLHNRAMGLHVKDWNLQLVGLGDLWAGEIQPGVALAESKSDADAIVVLSHNPDSKTELKPYKWDLLLCGHTHGGQVRLPFLGTPFAPVRDMRFVEGLHRWNERWIHITKGVGNLHGMRFNCRPEVSLLTLV